MGDLHLQLDFSELEKAVDDIQELESSMKDAIAALTVQTHAHIVEEAQQKLHSRRDMFLKALSFKQENEFLWTVTLNADAIWIDEGMPPHSMVEDLLRNNAKTAKDGSKYKVIPFEHSKGGTQQTEAARSLTETVKQQMKQMKVPWGKIERNQDGSPKTGMLHKFDVQGPHKADSGYIKTHQGPGQGHGPVGQVKQGNTGIPFLQGVRVYQHALFNDDGSAKMNKKGQQAAKRSVMTFRIVSSKHAGEKWNYPGTEGKFFFDEAAKWAEDEWDRKIVPGLLTKFGLK